MRLYIVFLVQQYQNIKLQYLFYTVCPLVAKSAVHLTFPNTLVTIVIYLMFQSQYLRHYQ